MGIKNKHQGPEPIPKLERWQEVALDHRSTLDEMVLEYQKAFPGTRAVRAKLNVVQYYRSVRGARW